MQNNRKNEHDDVDLTGIINDYSKDSELRRKIEEMKRQKEAQTTASASPRNQEENAINPLTGEKFHSPIFEDKKASTEKKAIPDIRVDEEELAKTRVGFVDDTNDQTLVIMNGKKSLTAAEEPQDVTMTQQMPISDYDEEAEDEEKLGKTIVQPLSDVHVLDEDEEPLPVKKSIKKTTSKKEEVEEDEGDDEEKNTKINKIITYVILGIVGILIIVACFFAVQYAMDTFLGGNDNKKAPEQTEEPTTPTKDPTNTDANKDDTNNKDDVTDSSAKIAALKKQRETYVQRKADANDKLELAEKDKKDATETLASLEKNELAKAKEAQKLSLIHI